MLLHDEGVFVEREEGAILIQFYTLSIFLKI